MRTIIRLQRCGPRKRDQWRIVVQGHYKKLNGEYIEHIGSWFPKRVNEHERAVLLNKYRARYWLSCGAVVSPRVQLFFSYYGLTPAPWVPFGRKTLYDDPKRRQHEVLLGASKFFEQTVMSPSARHYAEAVRQASEESLYFRKLKLTAVLPDYLATPATEESINQAIESAEGEDDVVSRSEKFHFLRAHSDALDAVAERSSPLRRSLLHKKMNELAERGVLEPATLAAEKEQRKREGPTVDAVMRARLAHRRDQATKNYAALMDMTQTISRPAFESALVDRGVTESEARNLTAGIFEAYKGSGHAPTYVDLETVIMKWELKSNPTRPMLTSTHEDDFGEARGSVPRITPTTPPPDFTAYDPKDWYDFREDQSASVRPVHKRGDKWFETPMHDAKMDRRLKTEVDQAVEPFKKQARRKERSGLLNPLDYFSAPFYTTKNLK